MERHYRRIVALSAGAAEHTLAMQDTDPESRYYGGVVSTAHGYAEPGGSGSTAARLLSFYLCPEHPRYGDRLLLDRAGLLVDFLLREQHEDGTVDLKTTNFHDATMIGFVMQNLAYTYRLVDRSLPDHPELEDLGESLAEFIRRGAEGMRTGGFHTPNHRWVLASGLSLAYRIVGDDRYREEAERYLAEGIDCTEEGEYTERSVGVYNVVNNRSLMIVAEELDRPELLDHVGRNLSMVLNYVEPDGSLFTMNSRRQDQGERPYPATYYENYLLMAHRTGNERFAAVAEEILSRIEIGHGSPGSAVGTLTHFLLDASLRESTVKQAAIGFPSTYEFVSEGSQIARFRSGLVSTSVLGRHDSFLRFQVGEAVASVRAHGTFYGEKGRFRPDGIERDGDELVLRYENRWGYVRPFDTPPPSRFWDEMPHGSRERVHMHDYRVTVRIRPSERSVDLRVGFEGLAGVLTRVELIFGAGGFLDADGLRVPGSADGWAILGGGDAVYSLASDRIRIRGGGAAHSFARDMRGGQSPVPGSFTVFATGETPCEIHLSLEAEGRVAFAAGSQE